jgi:predicted PurR-regulated permease PerM
MSVYTIKQSKAIAISLIIIIGIFLIYSLNNLFNAILASFILYILFKPLFIGLIVLKKVRRVLAASIVIIISFIIIIIPFSSLAFLIIDKVIYYQENPESISKVIKTFEIFIGNNFEPEIVKDAVESAGNWILNLFPSFIDTTLHIIITIGMMYFILYFMFTKYEVFESVLIKYMPFRGQNSIHFVNEFQRITYATIIGQGIVALAQGIFLGIGFIIFGIPDPLFWGVICFFLSFLPVIGSAGVFVPAGLIEIAYGDTFSGFGILIYGFVAVANIDNLLRLWINKWIGNIHPLITIIGIVIGIPLFGILGLVFGPLLISFSLLLVRMYEAVYADNNVEKERIVESSEL